MLHTSPGSLWYQAKCNKLKYTFDIRSSVFPSQVSKDEQTAIVDIYQIHLSIHGRQHRVIMDSNFGGKSKCKPQGFIFLTLLFFTDSTARPPALDGCVSILSKCLRFQPEFE